MRMTIRSLAGIDCAGAEEAEAKARAKERKAMRQWRGMGGICEITGVSD